MLNNNYLILSFLVKTLLEKQPFLCKMDAPVSYETITYTHADPAPWTTCLRLSLDFISHFVMTFDILKMSYRSRPI